MKIRKIALCFLLVLLMVSVAILAVACNKETKLDLKPNEHWGPASDDEEELTIINATEADGNLVINFNAKKEWTGFAKTLSYEDPEILAKMNTLVVTAKMETNNPYPSMMFKMDVLGKEVKVKGTADFTTYEWDVSEMDLAKETWLIIFPDPGVNATVGKITISEIYLTSREMNAEKDATKMPPDSAPPVDTSSVAWKEITATDTKVDAGWYDGGAGIYTVAKSGTSYNVNVTKAIGTEWSAVIAYIHGDALKTMKSFKIVVKGTAGTKILVKPFDTNQAEETLTLTGKAEGDELIMNVAAWASSTDRDFSKKDTPTADNRVALIAYPNDVTSSGSFEIVSAEFSTAPAPVKVEVSEITATNKKVDAGWYDGGDGVYTVTKDGTSYKVAYDKGVFAYASLKAWVKGDAIANMKTIQFTMRGTAGKSVILKPFDQVELRPAPTFSGTEDDTFIVDIAEYVAGKSFTEMVPIVIMIEGGVENVSGEFIIKNVEFSTEEAPVTPVVPQAIEYGGDLTLNVNNEWHDGGDGKWTASKDNDSGIWTANFPAGNDWSQLVTEVKLGDAKMNYVVLEVKGTQGTKAIFNVGVGEAKFEGNTGDYGVMTGEWQKVVVSNLATPVTGDITLRVFAGLSATCAAGEIQIKTATMYYVSAVAEAGEELNINTDGALSNAVKGGTRNTISFAENKTTITYSSPSWDSVIMWIDLGEGGFDQLELEFKGLEGHTAILSLNGLEAKYEGNTGDLGKLTGNKQTLPVDVSELKGIIFIRIFLDMNEIAGVNEQGGSFEITKAVFTRSED